MKTKNQFKYIIAVAALLLASCTTLDEEPKSSQVSNQFYKNESDAQAAVFAIYSSLIRGNDAQSMYNRGIQLATETTTDDFIAGPRAYNANVQALSRLAHDASNDRMQSIWQDHYQLINYANIAIDRIAEIPDANISPAKREQFINEAKFLRALAYFNLVRWFKYIPLQLHETTTLSSETLNVSQADEDEVYAQIIQDLKDAESLPKPADYASGEAGRATAGSAKALLAKVYLTRQQWQQAADKAKEIIDSGWYDLFENFNDVFDAATKNGKEHIFSIQFTGYTTGLNHMLAISEATFEAPGINGQHYDAYNVKSNLYESYEKGDQRLSVTFITEITSPTDGKTYTLSEPHLNKYYDQNSVGSQANSSRNIPVIRYAEILLIYAEALNELGGPSQQAYAALDKVRTRAGVTLLKDEAPNASKDEFREFVFEERRKELTYEYQRWFDLSRRGAEYYVEKLHAAGKSAAAPRHIHLPIPQRELDLNPNLKQNPDWDNF